MFDRSTQTGLDRISAPPSWSDFKALVSSVFWQTAALVVVATWVVFWALVMRLHLIQGQFLSAGVVGLLFVIPALVGLSAYLGPLPDPQRLAPSLQA